MSERYVYAATVPRDTARASALERLVRTYFDDSPAMTVAALLNLKGDALTDSELASLVELIENARREGR